MDLLDISEQASADDLVELWTGHPDFPLLAPGAEGGLPWPVLLRLAGAMREKVVPGHWPSEAAALCDLWAGRLPPWQMKPLISPEFLAMLQTAGDSEQKHCLINLVKAVEQEQVLPDGMQLLLLEGDLAFPDEAANRDLVRTFAPGLKQLHSQKKVVSVKSCTFRSVLRTVADDEGVAGVVPPLP